MERPIDKHTKVKILTGEHKGKVGTYQYHCCSGHAINLANGDRIYLDDRSDFSIVKKPAVKKSKATKAGK